MINEPENELFSAYLDGELTAEDQAKVERLLATSPAARQLLDELRALSSTLQDMPQYKLGEDISEQVLRKAERQILTRSAPPEEQPSATPRRPIFGRSLDSRMLFWPAAAVAVALMLMLFGPQQPDGPNVANAPNAVLEEDALKEAPETVEAGGEDAEGDARVTRRVTTNGAKPGETAGKGVAAPRKDAPATAEETDRAAAELRRKPALHAEVMKDGGGDSSGAAKARTSLIAESIPPASDAPIDPTARKVQPGVPAPAAPELPAPTVVTKSGPASPAPAQPPTGPSEPQFGSGTQVRNGGIAGSPSSAPADRDYAKSGAPFRSKQDAFEAPGGSSPHSYGHAQSTRGGIQTLETTAPDQIACVVVGLSEKAAHEGIFDKLLPTNDIDWDASGPEEYRGLAGYHVRGTQQQLADPTLAKRLLEQLARTQHEQQQKAARMAKAPATAGRTVLDNAIARLNALAKLNESGGQVDLTGGDLAGVDLVWVKATSEQIEATLDDLNQRPEDFISLDVDPAREFQEQQVWKRYSRVDDTRGHRSSGDRQAEPAPEETEDELVQEARDQKKAEDVPTEGAATERNLAMADKQKFRGQLGRAWRAAMPEAQLEAQLFRQQAVSGGGVNAPRSGGLAAGGAVIHGKASGTAESRAAPVQAVPGQAAPVQVNGGTAAPPRTPSTSPVPPPGSESGSSIASQITTQSPHAPSNLATTDRPDTTPVRPTVAPETPSPAEKEEQLGSLRKEQPGKESAEDADDAQGADVPPTKQAADAAEQAPAEAGADIGQRLSADPITEDGQQQSGQSYQAWQGDETEQHRQAGPADRDETRYLVLFILRADLPPTAASTAIPATGESEVSQPAIPEPNAPPATRQ